jgi:hypothetical protein
LTSYLVGVEEIQAVASPTDNLLGLRLGRLQDYFPDAAHVFPGRLLFRREGGDDFLEARIAAERVPDREQF